MPKKWQWFLVRDCKSRTARKTVRANCTCPAFGGFAQKTIILNNGRMRYAHTKLEINPKAHPDLQSGCPNKRHAVGSVLYIRKDARFCVSANHAVSWQESCVSANHAESWQESCVSAGGLTTGVCDAPLQNWKLILTLFLICNQDAQTNDTLLVRYYIRKDATTLNRGRNFASPH